MRKHWQAALCGGLAAVLLAGCQSESGLISGASKVLSAPMGRGVPEQWEPDPDTAEQADGLGPLGEN